MRVHVWMLGLLQKKWITRVSGLWFFFFFFLQCSQTLCPMKLHRKHFIVYIYVIENWLCHLTWAKFIRLLILSFSLYHQIEDPLKRCWPLTCVNYWFFSIECTNDDVISVSVARNSRNVTSLNLIPAPHKRYTCSYMSSKILGCKYKYSIKRSRHFLYNFCVAQYTFYWRVIQIKV